MDAGGGQVGLGNEDVRQRADQALKGSEGLSANGGEGDSKMRAGRGWGRCISRQRKQNEEVRWSGGMNALEEE